MRFLNPTNDVAFKKIFGNENRKDILISFLNSILKLPQGKRINEVEILNPFQAPHIKSLKESILDVRCRDERGITYIVEMQVAKPSDYDKRVLYYTSKAYVNQLGRGEDYPELNQIIYLGILDFKFLDTKKYISDHLILDKEDGEHIIKDFRFCFVELPKFKKELHELEKIEDKWIYFLKHAEELKIIPQELKDEAEIEAAIELLEEHNWSKEDLELYDVLGIYRQDERGRVIEGYNQGKVEGLVEGRAEGKAEGEEIGLAKGRAEGEQEKEKAMIKTMHQNGLSPEQIAQFTGLTLEQIKGYLK